jgi:hypothetical protein
MPTHRADILKPDRLFLTMPSCRTSFSHVQVRERVVNAYAAMPELADVFRLLGNLNRVTALNYDVSSSSLWMLTARHAANLLVTVVAPVPAGYMDRNATKSLTQLLKSVNKSLRYQAHSAAMTGKLVTGEVGGEFHRLRLPERPELLLRLGPRPATGLSFFLPSNFS